MQNLDLRSVFDHPRSMIRPRPRLVWGRWFAGVLGAQPNGESSSLTVDENEQGIGEIAARFTCPPNTKLHLPQSVQAPHGREDTAVLDAQEHSRASQRFPRFAVTSLDDSRRSAASAMSRIVVEVDKPHL